MAEDPKTPQAPQAPYPTPPALSERLQKCIAEIEALVLKGVEHQQYEFKRTASITKEDLDDRLDLIKLVQGVANSEVAGERYIVIGADPKERKFFPVSNAAEFDPARVNSVLTKYLDPLPAYEVFNNLDTNNQNPIVVFILASTQPRPIIVKTEGKKLDGKVRLQVGEIWVKKGTALQLATRMDIDAMYRQRMEEEAEDRARKRFKHFTEVSGPPPVHLSSPTRMPVRESLLGPPADFRRFFEELMAASDNARFLMLVELIRESLVEGWDRQGVRNASLQVATSEYVVQVNSFFRDEFLPSLRAAVSVALLIIKNRFDIEWLKSTVEILLEAFEECRHLQQLKSGYFVQMPGSLRWWRPGFEHFMAFRGIAAYSVLRNRPRYLNVLLSCFAERLTVDDQPTAKMPILFWPLPPQMFDRNELIQGRATFFWNERIQLFCGSYFGTFEKFLAASCQLEFILEFNSYLGTNSVKDRDLKTWLESNARHKYFVYNPDLFAYPLDSTIPMAERLHDMLASRNFSPSSYEILPGLFDAEFKSKNIEQVMLVYGEFLDGLRAWQENAMMQHNRFPFMFSWPHRLEETVETSRAQRQRAKSESH